MMAPSFIYQLLLILMTAFTSAKSDSIGRVNKCDDRIIGGYEVDITDIPFQVSLDFFFLGHFCGGVVISRRWVLTAGHCVGGDFTALGVFVRFGSTFSDRGGLVVTLKRAVQHPKYNDNTLDYDVTLLELGRDLPLDDQFYAVDLPEQDEPIEDGHCVLVSGWGVTHARVDRLHAVHVPIVNFEECREVYKDMNHVTRRMICAGYPEGGKNACYGDSGGPMVDGRKLIGLVSWGVPYAAPGYPGVYTRVAAIRNWITQVSKV
ncbi:trypsin-7-like [Topomyia yanbarensis]|uniref:trypsin-7-like n=1 Tax=Topomyia yanbarensis TaxID=2498891 RepID=UPI00273B0B84|nr:trypsin-7-like [Topomyia yanbarensis]